MARTGIFDNMDVTEWLATDETAKNMLARVLAQRLRSLLTNVPILHQVSLHSGHVLEVVGPSGSAKSELLLQAAVSCILPKQWDGIMFGGSEGAVMMFDLDCRFDMMRLMRVLQLRINEARGVDAQEGTQCDTLRLPQQTDDLFLGCLKRFLYTRCYNSFQFLAALKTIRPQLKKLAEHGINLQMVMIDSIGAFYWLDRAVSSTFSSGVASGRTALSLQVVSEAVVQELYQLLETHPMLILATKSMIYSLPVRDGTVTDRELISNEFEEQNPKEILGNKFSKKEKSLHREYMPAVWKAFVTHRLILRGPFKTGSTEIGSRDENLPFFTAEWETPSLRKVEKFIVQDRGIKFSG